MTNPSKFQDAAIGLDPKASAAVCEALEHRLGDAWVLYAKTRNFHWNVEGPNFSQYHALFQAQYEALDEEIDALAERLRALGRRAPGSLKEFLALSGLKESLGRRGAPEMIGELLAGHEALARSLRADLDACEKARDQGTADFLTGLLEGHEKTAWMLRATLG